MTGLTPPDAAKTEIGKKCATTCPTMHGCTGGTFTSRTACSSPSRVLGNSEFARNTSCPWQNSQWPMFGSKRREHKCSKDPCNRRNPKYARLAASCDSCHFLFSLLTAKRMTHLLACLSYMCVCGCVERSMRFQSFLETRMQK